MHAYKLDSSFKGQKCAAARVRSWHIYILNCLIPAGKERAGQKPKSFTKVTHYSLHQQIPMTSTFDLLKILTEQVIKNWRRQWLIRPGPVLSTRRASPLTERCSHSPLGGLLLWPRASRAKLVHGTEKLGCPTHRHPFHIPQRFLLLRVLYRLAQLLPATWPLNLPRILRCGRHAACFWKYMNQHTVTC